MFFGLINWEDKVILYSLKMGRGSLNKNDSLMGFKNLFKYYLWG